MAELLYFPGQSNPMKNGPSRRSNWEESCPLTLAVKQESCLPWLTEYLRMRRSQGAFSCYITMYLSPEHTKRLQRGSNTRL